MSKRYIRPRLPSSKISHHPSLHHIVCFSSVHLHQTSLTYTILTTTTFIMPETTTPAQTPSSFGDNKGIKFHIKTGNARYQCVLQDRSA